MATKTPLVLNSTGQIEQLQAADNLLASNNILTGYSSASGTISATDNVLQAINKLNGNDALRKTGGSVHLNSDYTNATTSNVNTNLSFTGAANTSYKVTIVGKESKSVDANGVKMQISAPVGSTISGTWFRGITSVTSPLQNELITAVNTLSTQVFGNVATTIFTFRAEFTISISSTPGAVSLGAASVTAGTTTIYALSSMNWEVSTAV